MEERDNLEQKRPRKDLPIVKNEDVEFSTEEADGDDLEAVVRADEADRRSGSSREGG